MQLLSQESWLSAIHFKKSLRYAVKHGVIMSGAFAVTLALTEGPDGIYDYLKDLDTAILYESIEKSLRNTITHDTPSNQAVIKQKSVKDRNQHPQTLQTNSVITTAYHAVKEKWKLIMKHGLSMMTQVIQLESHGTDNSWAHYNNISRNFSNIL